MQQRRSQRGVGLRETRLLAAGVYLVAVVAWLAMIRRWVPMPTMGGSMAMSMTDPGVPEAMATGAGPTGWSLYLAMWAVMMIAMMYPSSVPLVRTYYLTLDGQPTTAKLARVGSFLGAYTVVWAATGIVPLIVNVFVPITGVASSRLLLAGTLFLLAGYQLSPYKDRCLRHCRTPLGFLMQHHHSGTRGAARMGVEHGTFCLGCCWALFAFMVVVGTMNLVWMAAITVVLSLERTVSWGEWLAKAVGVVAGIGGAGLLLITFA